MTAANAIHDAGLELFDADSQLVMAQGATDTNAVLFKRLALQALVGARKKIDEAERLLEKELFTGTNRE
jgi:hypothetical protein